MNQKKAPSFSTERIKTKRKTNFKQVSYIMYNKMSLHLVRNFCEFIETNCHTIVIILKAVN